MVVSVDVGLLQGWITIGCVAFGGICSITVFGIRIITKPMVKALTDLNTTVKEINNVPYAIKVCDSKGNIRQPGLPVYADNTAALAGGLVAGEPYRTSTGSLMVVY